MNQLNTPKVTLSSKQNGFTQHLASRLYRLCRHIVPSKKEDSKLSAGFTIVELLVTMIVGTLMVGSAILILTSHLHLSQRGRDLVIANAYIENRIEGLRSIGFAGLSDGITDITAELPTELNAPRSGNFVISSYSPAVKRVVATITYNDQGDNRTYSYTTYVGELGAGQY